MSIASSLSIAQASVDVRQLIDVSTASDQLSNYTEGLNHGGHRIARCLMTVFPPTTDAKFLEPTTYFSDVSIINNWAGQFEIAPGTGTLHAHIYVEFRNSARPRFTTLTGVIKKATGKTGNIKIAKSCTSNQRDCAVNYVLKPNGRAIATEPFIWDSNKDTLGYQVLLAKKKSKLPSGQDLVTKQLAHIESKPRHWSWNQILHESDESKALLATCSWGQKYHAGRHEANERRTIQNVILMYGVGGSGKTTMAQNWDVQEGEELHERYFKRNPDDGKFWGGGRTAYRGQRIIHLEEFCGQETAANFKEICDVGKHGPSVNIKNSGTELNHDTVIITSNSHPAAWYRHLITNDPKQWTPISRRFTQVLFFPEFREDNELNVPDEEHPPFFIDQTEDFKEFIRDFPAALRHANNHWPLPEESAEFESPYKKARHEF